MKKSTFLKLTLAFVVSASVFFACSEDDINESSTCSCTITTTINSEVISTATTTFTAPTGDCSEGNSTITQTVGDITSTTETVCE
ncbi:hypothetical protein N9V96_03590 [Polaribacter sp.]|nr:hypothetical protein [Polaribacter sp.]